MENFIVNYLKELEVPEFEAKVYLTILEVGPKTIRELAQILEINRTTAYLYVESLIEKGLIMKVVKNAKTLIVPNDPTSSLGNLVDKKMESVKSIQKDFQTVIEAINAKHPSLQTVGEAEIKYYKGRLGVRKIYEEALRAKELRSYANLSEMESVFPENLTLFSNAFQDNPYLKMFELVEDSPASRKQTQLSSLNDRYFYKFISNKVKLAPADTLIYDGKVSIINVKNEITGVILNNAEYYNNTKELFDFIWDVLPEPKRHL